MKTSFAVLAIAGVVLGAGPAAAQAHVNAVSCARTAEEGQRARAASKLRDARDWFQACVSDACPVLVRQDCGTWASEVTALLPTIVVDARDAAGRDVADVLVRVDGEVIATKLDGKSFAVDPGPHTLTFERIGFESVSQKAIIKEGIKARAFVVSFDTPRASPPPTEHTSPEFAGERGHTIWPWLVVIAGGGTAIVGVVDIATAPSEIDCEVNALGRVSLGQQECATMHNIVVDQRSKHITRGGILVGVGLFVAAVGLVWHFLEPTGPEPAKSKPSARLVPWSTQSGGGLAAVGTF